MTINVVDLVLRCLEFGGHYYDASWRCTNCGKIRSGDPGTTTRANP